VVMGSYNNIKITTREDLIFIPTLSKHQRKARVVGMINVQSLSKKFGDIAAVSGISFEVKEGEVFGLLGMLATMLKPTSGTATMAGWDIVKEPEKVRSSIGILFGLYDRLTCEENIAYFEQNSNKRKD